MAGAAISQVNEEWVKKYISPNNYDVSPCALTTDNIGNVYVLGSNGNLTTTYKNFVTLKYNPSGILLWTALYDGDGSPGYGANALAVDNDGNVYVTGSIIGTNFDYATVKYNSSGVRQWVAKYNGLANNVDVSRDIKLDNNGNIYITGYSTGINDKVDYVTIKYNAAGIQQWLARYNSENNLEDFGVSLLLDNSGNVFVGGYSSLDAAYTDYSIVKYDSLGIQQWATRYSCPAWNSIDIPKTMIMDNNGNIYITGTSNGAGTDNDIVTIKYNSAGIEKWIQRYNGPGNLYDIPGSIALDSHGNIYLAGETHQIPQYTDLTIIKYDSLGNQIWLANYNGDAHEYGAAYSMIVDDSDNVIITGYTDTGNNSDCITIKYSALGELLWIKKYTGIGFNNAGIKIKQDQSKNIYIAGRIRDASKLNMVTIKYSQVSGINILSNNLPSEFNLYQNYPNPFNPTTKIKFDIPKLSDVKIIVFDAVGREIKNITQNNLTPGSYEYEFNGENLSSGIYYFKLQTNDFSKSVKMVLLK